jgi:hypothetical protein
MMSGYREEPFDVSGDDQGGWVVDFDGKAVVLSNENEAELLADLPVQLYSVVSKNEKHDLNRIERILGVCDAYHLDHRFGAVRELRLRFKQRQAMQPNREVI